MSRVIEVVAYDPRWPAQFQAEAPRVAAAIGENCLAVHHIGSTAVPGLFSKPTIDLLVEAKSIAAVSESEAVMVGLGYTARGENGIPGRRYFFKQAGEQHLFHVHVFEAGHPEIARHLRFRDYLIAHPEAVQAYSRLKAELAGKYRLDPESYTEGKSDFIRLMDEKAMRWAADQREVSSAGR